MVFPSKSRLPDSGKATLRSSLVLAGVEVANDDAYEDELEALLAVVAAVV